MKKRFSEEQTIGFLREALAAGIAGALRRGSAGPRIAHRASQVAGPVGAAGAIAPVASRCRTWRLIAVVA